MENPSVFSISSSHLSQNSETLSRLITQAKQGHEGAFGEIYNLYFKKIYKFVYYRVSHKELAEDLTEEVFLKAFKKIGLLSKEAAFEGWLYQIARNSIIDYYRKKQTVVALEEVENTLEYETNVIDNINLEDQQKIFLKLLRELGEEQQLVLKLKFFEELENEHIAVLLNKTEGAIRVIQHRALQKLQTLISENNLSDQ